MKRGLTIIAVLVVFDTLVALGCALEFIAPAAAFALLAINPTLVIVDLCLRNVRRAAAN
jgi:hypothetical protein